MKIITDKKNNGLTNPEFKEHLLTPVPKTEFTTAEMDELHKKLSETLSKLEGIGGLGLSANQIGIRKRACLIKVDGDELFLVNPYITYRDTEGFLFYEGCLSIPKTMETPIKTIRSNSIKVQTDNMGEIEFAINRDGDGESISPETLRTVVIQHEIDHLDGITIRDRIYSTTVKKRINYGRNEKILMKSPQGEFVEVKYKKANDYFLKGYEII
jgi:peptide deformylase